jgi:hypothetical protein
MSEREALERFHNWRAARGRDAEVRRQRHSSCTLLMRMPVSIAIAALALAAGAAIATRFAVTQISCAAR